MKTECPTHKTDFFIIGAPKCGTTALYEYLKTHPDIFLPAVKEPTYFAEEFRNGRSYISTPTAYTALYKPATANQITGDASPFYLYSATAIQNILRCNPNAKFIALIRNPIDMLPSYHAQALRVLIQPEQDLETAWNTQSQSKIPNLHYKQVCSLGSQLKTLMETVPEVQRHIILFDDFKSDTSKAYQTVLSFLNLPNDNRTDFARVNQRAKLRSSALQKALRGTYYILKPLKPLINALGLRPFSKLSKLNQTKATTSKTTISPAFEKTLTNEFIPQIKLLEQLLERDLSHWYKKP